MGWVGHVARREKNDCIFLVVKSAEERHLEDLGQGWPTSIQRRAT